jgi:hypothetical protein
VIPNSRKNGVNPALFKSLYQHDKEILPRQVNEVEEGNGQSQAGVRLSIPVMFIK